MGLFQSRPSATAPSTTEQTPNVEPNNATLFDPSLSGQEIFDADLAEAVSSSRRALGFESKPTNPLPVCFFNLNAIDSCSFKFDFQWCSNDGAVLSVAAHDVEKYPSAHSWEVKNTDLNNPAPDFVESTLLRQKEWDGLRLRAMIQAMNDGFWGRH
jgi:hypothetical protein